MSGTSEDAMDHDRFAALGDLTTVFTWSGNADAQLEYANDAWLAFSGRRLEDELGDGWLQGVHPADRDELHRVIAEAYAKRVPFEHEYRIRDHAGRYRWVLNRGEPRLDESGTLLGFHGTALSVDDRVRAERATALLSEVGRLVASTGDPAAALEAIARAAIPLLGDCCVIDLAGDDGTFTRHVLAHHDPRLEDVARGLRGPQPHSPLYGVLESGRSAAPAQHRGGVRRRGRARGPRRAAGDRPAQQHPGADRRAWPGVRRDDVRVPPARVPRR